MHHRYIYTHKFITYARDYYYVVRSKSQVHTLVEKFSKKKVKMNFDDIPVVRNEKKFDDIVREALKGGDPALLVPPKSIAKDVLKETTGNVYAMSATQNFATTAGGGGTTTGGTGVDSLMAAKSAVPASISPVNANNNTSTDSPKRPFLKKGTGVKRIYTPPKERTSPSPLATSSRKAEQQVAVKDKTKMTAWELEEYEMQQEVENFEFLEHAIRREASKESIERAAEEFVRHGRSAAEMRSKDPLSYPYASKHVQASDVEAVATTTMTNGPGVATFTQTSGEDEKKSVLRKHRATSPEATSTPPPSTFRSSVRGSPMPPSSSQRINELARSSMSPAAINRSAIKRQENARKALDKDRAELERDMKNFKKQMMEFKEQKDDFASHMKRERFALEQKERSILGQSRTEREEIKILRGEIEKMKEDQKYRDQKAKLTVDRLRKQVENLSHEASALKLEKERMSEEMRRMKMAQRSHSSSTPVKTEPVVSKSMKSSPMFAKASPPPVYIDASPVEEVTNEHVKEEVEEQHVYDEEKVPDELLRTPAFAPAPIWNDVAETGVSEDVHADGKIIRKYMDGTKVTKFVQPNTFRVDSGPTSTMYYGNGDIRETISDANMHVVRYWYISSQTFQSNYKIGKLSPGQSEKNRSTEFEYSIFHYQASNEVEVGYVSGIKDLYKDNGEILRIYPGEGEELRGEVIGYHK